MTDRGWLCPRCEAVNAPSVLRCECSPQTGAWDTITSDVITWTSGPIGNDRQLSITINSLDTENDQ